MGALRTLLAHPAVAMYAVCSIFLIKEFEIFPTTTETLKVQHKIVLDADAKYATKHDTEEIQQDVKEVKDIVQKILLKIR